MTHVHIRSHHRVAGSNSAFTVQLNAPVVGTYKMIYNNIETKPTPWVWTGVDSIEFVRVADSVAYRIFLGELVDDTPATAATAIDGILTTAAIPGYTSTVATATDFDITFSEPYTIQWLSESRNTANQIFKKYSDETASVHSLTLDNVYNNPEHIYVVIDETSSTTHSNFNVNPDLTLSSPGEAFIAEQTVTMNSTSVLTFRTYRASSTYEVCPIVTDFEVILQK